MKMLFLASAFNGLTQRLYRELALEGHQVSVEVVTESDQITEAVQLFEPDLIICPFLKQRIPDNVWKAHKCLILHPGIEGDRGPSSLDWAITGNKEIWGVTLLEAAEELDAGDIWFSEDFTVRTTSKSSLYRREVSQSAAKVIKQAVSRYGDPSFSPHQLDYSNAGVKGTWQGPMKQSDRQINWEYDTCEAVVRKMNAADSNPGGADEVAGTPVYLYGARHESQLTGRPGDILARSNGAICRAAKDGAVWISQMKIKGDGNRGIKLPAQQVLESLYEEQGLSIDDVPEKPDAYQEISYHIDGDVAYLYFDFYNGAMNGSQGRRLKQALVELKKQPVKVIVLMGGEDFWSNGIHLNCIEASENPALESWNNINAINDVVEEIINTPKQLTVAALRNNAGAGGAIMALACDQVAVRDGVVLNPHYKNMGLYGSEYWTYLLPRRVGGSMATSITDKCLPMIAREAVSIGLADTLFSEAWTDYHSSLAEYCIALAGDGGFKKRLKTKQQERKRAERVKPLQAYRQEELTHMRDSFLDPESEYQRARRKFVYKIGGETPAQVAVHRQVPEVKMGRRATDRQKKAS